MEAIQQERPIQVVAASPQVFPVHFDENEQNEQNEQREIYEVREIHTREVIEREVPQERTVNKPAKKTMTVVEWLLENDPGAKASPPNGTIAYREVMDQTGVAIGTVKKAWDYIKDTS